MNEMVRAGPGQGEGDDGNRCQRAEQHDAERITTSSCGACAQLIRSTPSTTSRRLASQQALRPGHAPRSSSTSAAVEPQRAHPAHVLAAITLHAHHRDVVEVRQPQVGTSARRR